MEKKKQKIVRFLGARVVNDKTIRLVELDFEKFKDGHVVELVGKNGAGKSTLVKGVMSATTGGKTIKDKELLQLGLTHEIQIADGDLKVFMGYRVREISKGVAKGEPMNESFLYTRDVDGKVDHKPVIDGISMNAAKYEKIITTPLTFGIEDLYSETQTIVRKKIEDIYADQLSDLGSSEIIERISETRKVRDDLRAECERNSAFMDHFKDEKLDELKLEKLSVIPMEPIDDAIKELEIEKGITLKTPEEAKEKRLTAIKEEGRLVVGKVRKINEKRTKNYSDYIELKDFFEKDRNQKDSIFQAMQSASIPVDIEDKLNKTLDEWSAQILKKHSVYSNSKTVEKPTLIPIEDDVIDISMLESVPEEYKELMAERKAILVKYKTEKDKPIDLKEIDTKDIDAKIESKTKERKNAEHNNDLVSRFELWKRHKDAKGIHAKEVEALRKLYAKVDTGVKGLEIQPSKENEAHLWLVYNGHHSTLVFDNEPKEYRRLHAYSESQFAIIGILMQAALLDKKPKTARFVVIDGYNMTRESKALIGEVCAEQNIDLLLTRTDDRFKLDELEAGEVVIQNGELLLGGQDEK